MTVLEAVERSKTPHFMVKGAIKAAENMISPSENIIWAQGANVCKAAIRGPLPDDPAKSASLAGVLVVTDQRILFVQRSLGLGVTKEVQISDIRSIDSKAGPIWETLRIVGTSDLIVTYHNRKVMPSLRAAINEAIARKDAAKAPAPAQSSDIEQLQALKQLYDTGVLTAEEFAAKKAQILKL